jgi:uncharacterized membrane protein
MSTIERSIELDVPASKAYDAWTQFELFPQFMEDVEDVRQLDDRRLHWRARIGDRTEEWEATITEQIPYKRVAWSSTGGARNAGVVTFHRLSEDRSKLMLQMEVEPQSLIQKVGDALGIASRKVERDLAGFKKFVEAAPPGIEGWHGRVTAPPDAAQREHAGV